MSELVEGSELANKYRVLRLLGEGGMATVFEGEHMRLGQRVAIKVLHEDLMGNVELIARFEREGRALSKLKSRHVVRVFDVDETPTGRPFLVMERLEGSDLDQEIAARGPLPIGEAVGYVIQACSAMAEAHAVGVVHRDLKPSNLFLTNEGGTRIVKVLDFGIATDALPDQAKRLTRTESVMGTPVYMAPEQFRRTRDVDGRADIWALGATLYEMLTGKPPFSGTASTIGVAVVNDDYPPVEDARPDVPSELRAVIARTLEKDPAKRYPTMNDLADALAPFGDTVIIAPRSSPRLPAATEALGRASTRPAVMPVLSEVTIVPAATASTPAPGGATEVTPPPRRSPLLWIGLGMGLVVVGGAALLFATQGSFAARTTAAPLSSTPAALVAPAYSAPSATPSEATPSEAPSSATTTAIVPLAASSPAAAGSTAPVGSKPGPRATASARPSSSTASPPSSAKPGGAKPPNGTPPPLFFPGQ